ncbi:uncharacterized protein, partial [Littorina saxatilis]|uniref:uncharacterized protein n=1 Tax=Littorina saxatilis TaxID=31220 RepID=UPI0038B4E6ED
MEVRWVYRVLCACVVQLSCFSSWTSGSDNNNNEPMWATPFEGMDRIKLVGCHRPVDSGFTLIQLKNRNETILVAWVKDTQTCSAPGSTFAACVFDEEELTVTVKVVVTDLEYGGTEVYNCSTMYVSASGPTWVHHNITVTHQVSTTQAMSSTTTTESPTPKTGHSISSNQDALFPVSVVIVILTLLVVLVTLTCVLGVFYFRGRRRKRKSRDCDVMSVRSGMTDKSFYTVGTLAGRGFMEGTGTGTGTGRIMRQYSNVCPRPSPPDMLAPDVPGSNRVVMQYQRPSDTLPNASTM